MLSSAMTAQRVVCVALVLALIAWVSSAHGTPQAAEPNPAIVGGTSFAAWYAENGDDYDTIALSGGPIILCDSHQVTVASTKMNDMGRFRLSVAPGVYEIQLVDPREYIPYRRARFRLASDRHSTVNLYPISRAGWALTVHGDVALPDPQVAYDDYHPDEKNPELDLLVQYNARKENGTQVEYEGPFLMLTFDFLTLRARTLTVNKETLKATSRDGAFVDLGQTRMRVDSVELTPKARAIRLVTREETREIRF
jgi:hypothetical protein